MHEIIRSSKAPAPIGPYSQAVRAGGFIFVSGQVSIDPATGQVVADDVASQTRRAIESLRAILDAAGSSLEKIVKTTLYLRDMNDFAKVNEVYAAFFVKDPPARATIQAAALPKGLAVEIDAIAVD
ncbi:MAG: RidA family protein [Planctomycetes bacterium]|nr:RidA family protein [Planctomycetota bacterium]